MTKSSKHLLLVYCDLLGDYMIFRHQLRAMKAELETRFTTITWLCDASVTSVAKHFAATDLPRNMTLLPIQDYSYLGLNLRKLITLPLTASSLRKKLQSLHIPLAADEIWCPSLAPFVMNMLSILPKAPRKLGRAVEDKTLQFLQNQVFTELFAPTDFYQFIAYQHHAFFEKALGHSLEVPKISFPVDAIQGQFVHSELSRQPFVTFFPDSMGEHKQWPAKRFAELANVLYQETGLAIVLAGNKTELGHTIAMDVKETTPFYNLVGKTSVIQALDLIRQSQAVVCNDSFAMHAASALTTPFLCLTSGLYKGRYWPYPEPLRSTAPHAYVLPPTPQHHLSDITTEMVMSAFFTQLGLRPLTIV